MLSTSCLPNSWQKYSLKIGDFGIPAKRLQKICKCCQKFSYFLLHNLNKCCTTRVYQQKSMPIELKTSEALRKNKYRNLAKCFQIQIQAQVCGELETADPSAAPAVPAGAPGSTSACTLRRSGSDQHLRRARSRLYRSEILQENMRLKALAEIYTIHPFARL